MRSAAPQYVGPQYWWSLLVRGIVSVIFGILALVWPGLTLLFLVSLVGVYAFFDGVVAVAVSLQERRTHTRWWTMLLSGLIGMLFGALIFFWPGITAVILFYLIGLWAILTGIFEIIAAFIFSGGVARELFLAFGGILSVVIGILFLFRPVSSILSIVWALGVFAIIYGIMLFIRAFQHRSMVS